MISLIYYFHNITIIKYDVIIALFNAINIEIIRLHFLKIINVIVFFFSGAIMSHIIGMPC